MTLTRLTRIVGALLLASLLVPHLSSEGTESIWQTLPDLPLPEALAALAPALAGVGLLIAARVCKRPSTLALVALFTMTGALISTSGVGDRVVWDLLPFPESWTHHASALLALSLGAAAGVESSRESQTRRESRPLLAASVVLLAIFYAWPHSGEAPFMTVVRVLSRSAPSWKERLGPILLAFIVGWPLSMVVAAWVRVGSSTKREHPVKRVARTYALPAILAMVVYRSGAGLCEGVGLLITFAGVIALIAVLALLTSTLAVLATELPTRRTILAAFSALGVLTLGPWVLARPSHVFPSWVIRPPTPEGDALFAKLLPAWNDARADQDLRGHGDARNPSAVAVSVARGIDPQLGDAVEVLAHEIDRGGLGEARWYRLVESVNQASQHQGLPYYLDPTEIVVQGSGARDRWLRLDTWRIETTRRFQVEADVLTTLHVRKMNPERGGVTALGLSRDSQPFALVALDRIDTYEEDLMHLASLHPPRCMERDAGSDVAERASRRCGEVLTEVLAQGDPRAALVSTTERHELQHQIDGASLPCTGWVLGRIDRMGRDAQSHVNRELSAHIAQMVATDAPARLTLLRLYRFILLGRRAPEYYVAWLSLEALSPGRVGCASDAADCLAERFFSLASLDDDTLRARAQSAWRRLYGADLPSVHLVE